MPKLNWLTVAEKVDRPDMSNVSVLVVEPTELLVLATVKLLLAALITHEPAPVTVSLVVPVPA